MTFRPVGVKSSVFVFALAAMLLFDVISHPGDGGERGALQRRVHELAVIALLFLACVSHPAVREIFSSVGKWRLAILIGLLGLAVAGQLVKRAQLTYPFVVWDMYSSPPTEIAFYRYQATHASGAEQPFPFHAVSPSHAARPFAAGMNVLVRRLDIAQRRRGETSVPEQTVRRVVRALSEIHNRRRSDPIVAVQISRCAVGRQGYQGERSIACQTVLSTTFSEPPRGSARAGTQAPDSRISFR